MTIEHASATDLAALLELEVGFPEGTRWSQTLWRETLAASNEPVFIMREPGLGEIVAALALRLVADTADLDRIVVAPKYRRRGLATRLITYAVSHLEGIGRVLLEVSHANEAAIALYAGLGFCPIARRQDYYGTGDHAVVMELVIPQEGFTR